ncbi:MAG: hypothetical protein JXA90_09655 [Planctomycetes bacterium]|nr:hypothetical protein [Planctomycetota bacterium]
MDSSAAVTDTVFVVKEDQEHCFLFDSDDLLGLMQAVFRSSRDPEGGITREEAFEVLEGMIPERLRSV